VIECVAYRFEGHHEGDTEFYRTEEDMAEWRAKDPLRTYPERLVEEGVLSEEEYAEMEADVEAEIQAAIEFAKESPVPDPQSAYEGLYSEGV
jgi:pyruvate dehydrogenase E1 component alpha subunit